MPPDRGDETLPGEWDPASVSRPEIQIERRPRPMGAAFIQEAAGVRTYAATPC